MFAISVYQWYECYLGSDLLHESVEPLYITGLNDSFTNRTEVELDRAELTDFMNREELMSDT